MHFDALTLFILSSLPFSLTLATQSPLSIPSTSSVTLVDLLSADPDYTRLLKLLQRARLIPTLNRLNESTLFAPTNEAIERRAQFNQVWNTDLDLKDNINEQLRQELFYHMLNFKLDDYPSNNQVQVLDTLHYPRKPIEPPTHEPPPGPPWMPIPGGTLGGDPQRLRIFKNAKDKVRVGVNYFGEEGARVVKEVVDAANGRLIGIGDVLDVPKDLSYIISHNPKLSYLNKLMPKKVLESFNTRAALTVFLPTDNAWNRLNELERLYLESEFAEGDIVNILDMHTVRNKPDTVRYTDSLKDGSEVETAFGHKLTVSVKDDHISVDSSQLVEPDIYASNGVLHVVEELLIPDGALQITPEKYLVALNCRKFISLLRSVELTHLVNYTSNDGPKTILAVADDVMVLGAENPDIPDEGSEELKRLLLYHFLPDKWTPKNLKDGLLISTELREDGLGGKRQVLPVEFRSDIIEGDEDITGLRFGGAAVVAKPVLMELTDTIIYLLTKPVTPPTDPVATANQFLRLSNFNTAVFSTSLDVKLKIEPRTTILIPTNSAFEHLGDLITTHLFASSSTSQADLKLIILHHVVSGVEYENALIKGSSKSFPTLEGSDLGIQRDNKTATFTPSGGWTGIFAEVGGGDLLTSTGVVHELSEVMIPRSVELTNSKLMKAAEATTMTNLVTKAGFGWVLNGSAPPEGSEWANEDTTNLGWTLLAPIDDAFKAVNLTELWSDTERLKALVQQHIIPTPRLSDKDLLSGKLDQRSVHQPLPFGAKSSQEYSTIHSRSSFYGNLVLFAETDESKRPPGSPVQYLVRIKDWPESESKNSSARIMAWGRCTTNGATGGVIQIDRFIEPWQPSLWAEYGPPVAVGVGGVAVIGLFFWGVAKVWRRDTSEATYEPIGGFNGHDDAASS